MKVLFLLPDLPPWSRAKAAWSLVTGAPAALSWGALMRARALEIASAFRDSGAKLLEIPVSLLQERGRAVSSFAPDFVTAPNGGYLLQGLPKLPGLLDLPMVFAWDDPLGQLAILWASGTGDALARFKEICSGDNREHFAWDSGHIEALDSLGILPKERITWYPICSFRPFLTQRPSCVKRGLVFAGNFFAGVGRENPASRVPPLASAAKRVAERRLWDLGRSAWSLLLDEIRSLPEDERPNPATYRFWEFYLYAVWNIVNAEVRLGVLSRVRRPIDVFGNFSDPEGRTALKRAGNLRDAGCLVPRKLAAVQASTAINLVVSHSLIQQGIPSKLVDVLASGAFALVDPKRDLTAFFGKEIKRLFFSNAEELNDKIDYFLSRPAERLELAALFSEKVRRECTPRAFTELVVGHMARKYRIPV